VQTKASFNVIGPGGTAYFFRRTRGLPEAGLAVPARTPTAIPVDLITGETGYVMRRGKALWGKAKFDPVREQWHFVHQPIPLSTTHQIPAATSQGVRAISR
jgi:hypothetical protein